jgi:transcriptional regulator with XRE-family HTH domain
MAKTYMPNYWGRLLLRELTRLRNDAGLRQREVEKKLKFGSQKVSRFEGGGQVPIWHEVTAMLDLYGVITNDWKYFEELWDKAKIPGWWRAFGLTNPGYVALEHEASDIQEFVLGFIPGILQTKEYARAVFESYVPPRSEESIERGIAIRMRRKERLADDRPLNYHAVIHEAVLLSGGVDSAQLLHLVEQAERPNVTIQILPLSACPHLGLAGQFTILAFPVKDEALLWFEDPMGGQHEIWNPEKVAAARVKFEDLANRALDEADSIELIRKLIL